MRFNVIALSITLALFWGAAILLVSLANLIWPGFDQPNESLRIQGSDSTITNNIHFMRRKYRVLLQVHDRTIYHY